MDKKTQIINAALKVFAIQGLEKGKIADIAKVAGIGKGTVYEYFKSKNEIFTAIEQLFVTNTISQIESLMSSNKSPTEKMGEIVRANVNMHEVMGDTILIISEMWAQHSRGQWHGHKKSIFAEMYKNYHKAVIDILAEGIISGEFRQMNKNGVAALLLAFIDGMIWQSLIFKDNKKYNQRINDAIEAFMRGIKK